MTTTTCPCGDPIHWGADNPFGERLARSLSRLSGLHRSPPTDRESPTVEAKIQHARDTAEAMAADACPF